MQKKNKILVIGWDAADWKVITPLIEQGKMPALQSLMARGAHGRIQTLDPPLSPMLWTSIATGVRADKHGIGGFVEPLPNGEGLRPVTTTSRKVKAIWNIFNQEGWKSNVVAWWPSNPAEPINGVMVSNLYQVANKALGEEWEMPTGTVHPEELSDSMKEFRVHPHEITLAMAIPFIPGLAENVELRKEKKTLSVLKTLANAASIHAASTFLMEEKEWDFMAVYHDAIDHFCHIAMRYYPPRRPEIPELDYENYNGVVEAGYRFHDMMLERTLSMIDENTTVVLLSDHGFHSDHQRPLYIPNEPSGPAVEHSPYGIFVIAGPGIKKGVEISGASVLDVTPTLLYHAGLAVGKDMEGKVLYQCFEQPTEANFISSWEEVPGDSGMHDEVSREDPWAAQEALQQLVELGYIDALDDDKLTQVEKCKRENAYYVARNMIHGGRFKEAIDILEKIFEESDILRYGQRLAFAYLSKKMYLKCQDVLDKMKEIDAQERIRLKQEKEANPNDPFGNEELEEPLYLEYIEGLLNLAMNKPRKALPLLEKVQEKNPNNMQLSTSIAQIHMQRKNYDLAEKQFIRALSIDNRNTTAHYGLGVSMLRTGRYEDAIDELLQAIEQDFFQSTFHYHLGEALYNAGNIEEAAQAFEVCVRITPGMTKAHKWLVDIYSNKIIDDIKAEKSIQFLKNHIKGEIIVVTGVDGCDYSFFLDLLKASKLEIAESSEYIENPAKHFSTDYLTGNIGKVLYISSRYLAELPAIFNYKVIYLNQQLSEILEKRKSKLNLKVPLNAAPVRILNTIEKEKFVIDTWLAAQPNQPFLMINWDELFDDIENQLNLISEFTNHELHIEDAKIFISSNL
jgi:predicted AlkP superfamily phosphohydrolase/phosphomutase/tetratricopeptide (TPR) repeat protein